MASRLVWPWWAILSVFLGITSGCSPIHTGGAITGAPERGHAQVAHLPHDRGLQYCITLRPNDLAPAGSRYVYVHSLSAYITTTNPEVPALLALTGRYPGWDSPDTTIYNQQFTNTNTVWLEIVHEFPLGTSCMEAYGSGLLPSRYSMFDHRLLVAFSYRRKDGRALRAQKLFPLAWGKYLSRYSPRHPPRH